MNSLAEMVFDSLEPIQVPVKVGGTVRFVLTEASADAVRQYTNFGVRSMKLKGNLKDGVGGIDFGNMDGIADSDTYLLSLCLKEADGVTSVPLATILGWKNAIVDPLVKKLKEISGMEDGRRVQGDDSVKNS